MERFVYFTILFVASMTYKTIHCRRNYQETEIVQNVLVYNSGMSACRETIVFYKIQ